MSKIDINTLSIDELLALKQRIDKRLNHLSDEILIVDLDLYVRPLKILLKNNIRTLSQLKTSNYKSFRGLGVKSMTQIDEIIESFK
jgi:hypothetical protein